jgi:prefoldin subunit 5
MSHNDAMALLNRHKEELTAMKSNLDAAISQAKTAVEAHGKDRKELQTKMGKRAKKATS